MSASNPPASQAEFESFRARREAGNRRVLDMGHVGIKRFFRLDVDAYTDRAADGGLDHATKELLGLVGSAVLRCDDCVDYHLEQCQKAGWTRVQIEEALNVALIVGGSIVIPHLRHATLTLDFLFGPRSETSA